MHHQAIKEIGERLRATAISEDGLIEELERSDRGGEGFVLGCQWHPEELMADPRQAQLVTGFVEACAVSNIQVSAL